MGVIIAYRRRRKKAHSNLHGDFQETARVIIAYRVHTKFLIGCRIGK